MTDSADHPQAFILIHADAPQPETKLAAGATFSGSGWAVSDDDIVEGATQAAILDELDARRGPAGEIDAHLAEQLVTERFTPV